MLGVGLDGSRRIQPAHLACPVGPDRSRPTPTDRQDDHRDDQGPSDTASDATASRTRAARQLPSQGRPPDPPPASEALPGQLTFRATAPPSDEATERAEARRDRPDEGAARASPDRGWPWPQEPAMALCWGRPRAPHRGCLRDSLLVAFEGLRTTVPSVRWCCPARSRTRRRSPAGWTGPVAGPGVVGIRQLPAAADEVPATPEHHPPDP
jgi:hypothetical protein